MGTLFLVGNPIAHADPFTVTISAQVNTSDSGGAGDHGNTTNNNGGGGSVPLNTIVTFSGRAYPLSRVTILENGQIAVTTIAGPDAKFSAAISGLSAGNYSFGVYSQDTSGIRSDVFSFPIMITAGVTTDISGIFIAPTISADKAQVKQGDNVALFGQAAPNANVVISVHSATETFHTVPTDSSGAYLLTLDTSNLELGTHAAKSKSVLPAEASDYGKAVNFAVGDRTIPQTACALRIGDLNCDGKVDLVDFSILTYWYKKANPPAAVDLNHDGVVNLVDFSILAYYWTG